jgi:hypothetical protein
MATASLKRMAHGSIGFCEKIAAANRRDAVPVMALAILPEHPLPVIGGKSMEWTDDRLGIKLDGADLSTSAAAKELVDFLEQLAVPIRSLSLICVWDRDQRTRQTERDRKDTQRDRERSGE